MNDPSTRMRFSVLDGWRGVAALSLVFIRFDTNGSLTFAPFVRNTYLFVDFFFVLSGFVIAHTYGQKLVGRTSVLAFAIRRFGRVWPLHAFMLLLYIVCIEVPRWLGGAEAFVERRAPYMILENALLIHSLGFSGPGGWNTPSWSISTELWTYMIFALVVSLAPNRKILLSALLVLGGLAIVVAFSKTGMNVAHTYGFPRCIAGFFAGVLTYEVYLRSKSSPPSRSLLSIAEVALVVVVVAFVTMAGMGPISFAAPVLFALVVWVFAFESGPVSRVLSTAPVQALGAWSYSIYMIALFVGEITTYVLRFVDRLLPSVSFTVQISHGAESHFGVDVGNSLVNDAILVAFVVLVVALSAVTYRWIEEPARKVFNRLADQFTEAQRVRAKVTLN